MTSQSRGIGERHSRTVSIGDWQQLICNMQDHNPGRWFRSDSAMTVLLHSQTALRLAVNRGIKLKLNAARDRRHATVVQAPQRRAAQSDRSPTNIRLGHGRGLPVDN